MRGLLTVLKGAAWRMDGGTRHIGHTANQAVAQVKIFSR